MPMWERIVLEDQARHYLPALIPNPEGMPEPEPAHDAADLPGADYAAVRVGGDA